MLSAAKMYRVYSKEIKGIINIDVAEQSEATPSIKEEMIFSSKSYPNLL
jgi:hypothetical protein